jgi:5,10-methylenetetrahydrofolate reductase
VSFRGALDSRKFVVTSEIGPPKGIDVSEMLEDAKLLSGRVDAINVTDLQSSVMRLGSLATCHLLKEQGFDPIFQMTCRDRNRLALQSDLLNAAVLGIENVLALTGDHTSMGDHPQAKPVFDLDSVQLLQVIGKLQDGHDMVGNELKGAPKFCVGAVVNPGADPIEPQIIKMEKKIEAGAGFFQTQGVYDLEAFEKFMERVESFKVPILAGVILLKSAGMAKFMNKNVAGVFVPDDLIEEMAKADDRVRTSIEIAARLIRGLKDICQGVHIMPIGWEKRVPALLDASGL